MKLSWWPKFNIEILWGYMDVVQRNQKDCWFMNTYPITALIKCYSVSHSRFVLLKLAGPENQSLKCLKRLRMVVIIQYPAWWMQIQLNADNLIGRSVTPLYLEWLEGFFTCKGCHSCLHSFLFVRCRNAVFFFTYLLLSHIFVNWHCNL